MLIAVHRWGGVGVKKLYVFSPLKHLYTIERIYSYTQFPFNPLCTTFTRPQNLF